VVRNKAARLGRNLTRTLPCVAVLLKFKILNNHWVHAWAGLNLDHRPPCGCNSKIFLDVSMFTNVGRFPLKLFCVNGKLPHARQGMEARTRDSEWMIEMSNPGRPSMWAEKRIVHR
jgi:hypothetical protein